MQDHSRLLKVEEAAEVLNVSRWTVYRLIKEKDLTSVKVRNGRRVPMASIRVYVAGLIEDAA
jgi:excisionase family DNA binding protein